MSTSKTAQKAMNAGAGVKERKVISDEDYIKALRYDVGNGIHATQEGAKALLRAYDAALVEIEASKDRAEYDEEHVATLEAQIEDQKRDIESLEREVEDAKAEAGDAESNAISADEEADSLRTQLEEARNEIERLHEEAAGEDI